MKSEFAEWFKAQHGPRESGLLAGHSEQMLRDEVQRGKVAATGATMNGEATPAKVRLTDGLGAWRPIEDMPRTGKMVLMWSRNGGFFAGNWPQGCAAGDWHKIGGDWRGSAHWRAQEATHWTPLPAAPK